MFKGIEAGLSSASTCWLSRLNPSHQQKKLKLPRADSTKGVTCITNLLEPIQLRNSLVIQTIWANLNYKVTCNTNYLGQIQLRQSLVLLTIGSRFNLGNHLLCYNPLALQTIVGQFITCLLLLFYLPPCITN